MTTKFTNIAKTCVEMLCFLVIILNCHRKLDKKCMVINISNTPGRSEHPSIAVDSRGYFYIVWDDKSVNEESLVVYMVTRSPTGEWSKPMKVFESRAAQFPDVEIDNSNTLHLVWRNTNPAGWGEVLYTSKPFGSNWTDPDTISIYGMSCSPDLVLDKRGNAHIVWQELLELSDQRQFYIKKTKGGIWTKPIELFKKQRFSTGRTKNRRNAAGLCLCCLGRNKNGYRSYVSRKYY